MSFDQYLIFPYADDGKIIPEEELRRHFPKGYEYLRKHKKLLSGRSEFVRRGERGPWYQLFCVYPETFAPHKVVWREQSSTLTPGALIADEDRPIIPDHKLMFLPCASAAEAYYLYCVLNSSIIRYVVESVSIETQNSTRVMDALAIPKFNKDNPTHEELSNIGRRITKAGRQVCLREINTAVAFLQDLTPEDRKLLAGM